MRGRALIDAAERSGARLLLRTSCLTLRGTEAVLAAEGEQARKVTAGHVLLAPGAHDRPVAFPGWTLPGVLTAGAAQTIVKAHRVTPGERLLFAGSGPLALAFPAQLHHYGVNVVGALEAGPAPRPARRRAARRGGARERAAASRRRCATAPSSLRGRVPLRYRRIVVRAEGTERVEAVVHAAVDDDWRVRPGTEERVEVDALCIGYGFFPSVELFRVAGCELRLRRGSRRPGRRGRRVAADDASPACSRPATARASAARTSPRTRAGSRCSGSPGTRPRLRRYGGGSSSGSASSARSTGCTASGPGSTS